MIRGEIEFLADSMLIEKLAWIDSSLTKHAGFGDTLMGMLDSGLTRIKDSVAGTIGDLTDSDSIVQNIGKMISTGALFMMWPPLGIINAAADQLFGINIVSIGKKIWDLISGSLESKGSVSPQEVTDAARQVTSEIAGAPIGTDSNQARDKRASFDLLEPLRTLEKEGRLYKIADAGGLFSWIAKLPIFKGKSLIGGLAGWAIKAALLGAGLLAGAGFITRLVGLKKNEPKPTQPAESGASGAGSEGEPVPSPTSSATSAPAPKLTPTGRGEKRHPNTPDVQWYVPVVGGSVERTLLTWAKDVYQELGSSTESMVRSCSGFQRAAEELSSEVEYTSNQIKVPSKFKTRKQIVDMFAAQAAAKL